jgi:pyruvate/2-oxoglutarate dehydrogenase complex dihydrolipoamide acyltransferase (E2) component
MSISGSIRATVFMPGLGDLETGTVLEWLHAPGGAVRRGEASAVVDADKVTVDVEAPDEGYLEILVAEGESAAVGEPIAHLLSAQPGS